MIWIIVYNLQAMRVPSMEQVRFVARCSLHTLAPRPARPTALVALQNNTNLILTTNCLAHGMMHINKKQYNEHWSGPCNQSILTE